MPPVRRSRAAGCLLRVSRARLPLPPRALAPARALLEKSRSRPHACPLPAQPGSQRARYQPRARPTARRPHGQARRRTGRPQRRRSAGRRIGRPRRRTNSTAAGSGGGAVPLCQAETASYAFRQQQVCLVPVVARMRRFGDGGCAPAHSRLADGFSSSELLARQVDVDSRRESIPHMALDALTVEIDIRAEDVAAEQVLNDERSDVALATARILGCPPIILVRRVETPGVADRTFEIREGEHSKTLTRQHPCPAPACRSEAR